MRLRPDPYRSRSVVVLLTALTAVCTWSRAQEPAPDLARVGIQPDGRILVPTGQILSPAGRRVAFPGRPVDLALMDGGKTLAVKNMADLVFIDVAKAEVVQILPIAPGDDPSRGVNMAAVTRRPIGPSGKSRNPDPIGFSVVGLIAKGNSIFASDAGRLVRVARKGNDGRYAWADDYELTPPAVGGEPFPAGIARGADGALWVASSRGNTVQRIDPASGRVDPAIPVGVAPYMVIAAGPDRFYVSNWGGDPPAPGQPQAKSSGTPVRIDPATGVANQGTVTVIGRDADGRWAARRSIAVGLHPSGMAIGPRGARLYVANANSDTVSVIDTRTDSVVETIDCRPGSRLPFGSGSNALAVAPDGATLYVANGTNNAVAVVRLGARAAEVPRLEVPVESAVAGFIPTGWYPGALALSADGRTLFVANVKGEGSLSQPRPVAQGKNTHDFLGTVAIVDLDDAMPRLADLTAQVEANNRQARALAGVEAPRPGVAPAPVPERHGEPSTFEHVVYVIKENRTYDQILGDMPEGDGDPALVLFGEEVTPNQHALARQFVLLDNFYCNGALSATGHQWVNEAYVVDTLEKSFGGFTRSYPVDGDDPLAFAASGFLWDNALKHGKTFRNFGEFCSTAFDPPGATWDDLYADYRDGTRKVKLVVTPNVASLKPHTHPGYPGFPLTVPDVYRAQIFLEELQEYERKGAMPNLVYVFLPADHTMGTRPGAPTPRAMVADNDLALGRVVEAITRSRFWPKTCIFVVEDDPQFGFDHVDGHRTLAQAISPYTRRGLVDHANYNQAGLVKTVELMLGLPPMNQLDLAAAPLRGGFRAEPDLSPYAALPNRVPLDERNPPLAALEGEARRWAEASMALDLDDADEADEGTFNRILWHASRGEAPYPERFVGPRSERAGEGR